MQLITYRREGSARTGALVDGAVIDLNRAYRFWLEHTGNQEELAVADARVPTEMIVLLNAGRAALDAAAQAVKYITEQLPEETGNLHHQGVVYHPNRITFLPPVLRPGKVICLGLNYRAHAAEAGMTVPQYPVLFHKVATSLTGHQQPIWLPRDSEQIDFEAELAVVIGRRGKYIAEEAALNHVAGYTNANDVSARDLQFRTPQWTTGKMLDSFCPLGPAIVTADEIPDPNTLNIQLRLNGEVMQRANTRDMIFNVAQIVSYISRLSTLEPGDLILTGTPSGIGNTRNPQVFMRAGDHVEVEVEKLGTLSNPVMTEP